MISRRKFLGLLAAIPGVNYAAARGEAAEAAAPDAEITHAKIHPAIGIARVGNSREEFFIGPEVPEAPTRPPGEYKDSTGALKRQAARFRIYGYNAAGEAVRELTPDNAAITWTAHLANKKGAWYEFHLALDIPEASLAGAAVSRRRNPQVTGADRQKLIIDPGPRSIAGKSTRGTAYEFNTGKFFDLPVPLGEVRTDETGRLLVLGGFGLSRSLDGLAPAEFSNNTGWHDDTADGPVDAKVMLANREIPVEGAWAVVGPPNFAPALKTVRTLHDLLYDCLIKWGQAKAPEKVSFTKHIAPIFRHLSGLQWVNKGFAAIFGFGAMYDADRMMSRLADTAESGKSFRQLLYLQFRNAKEHHLGKSLWPPLYGDAWDSLNNQEPDVSQRVERAMAQLSDTQLGWLKKWALGDFVNDLAEAKPAAKTPEEWPVAEQPAALDEAALAYCVADAFHPGCEVTWPVRHQSLYSGPLRIRRRPAGETEPDYGEVLTPKIALAENGPLNASGPGDLTRWMAIPWQTDTATCLWSYDVFRTSASLPSFWPARVPNEVLTEANYQRALDRSLTVARRRLAFTNRQDWFRAFEDTGDIGQIIKNFHKLGIIEERPGATDVPQLPARMFVESKPDFPLAATTAPRENAFLRVAKMLRRFGGKSAIS